VLKSTHATVLVSRGVFHGGKTGLRLRDLGGRCQWLPQGTLLRDSAAGADIDARCSPSTGTAFDCWDPVTAAGLVAASSGSLSLSACGARSHINGLPRLSSSLT